MSTRARDTSRLGRWLVALYWHLEGFRSSPEKAIFETSIRSAQAGILLERIRRLERVEWSKLVAIALGLGLGNRELKSIVLPILEATELIEAERVGDEVKAVREYVFDPDRALAAVGDAWLKSSPSAVERAVLASLELCSRRPLSLSEYLHEMVRLGFTEDEVDLARDLQRSFRLLMEARFEGVSEPYIYNEYIWGERAPKVVQYLDHLDPSMKELVAALLEKVRQAQGYPQEQLGREMDPSVVTDAEKIGLVDGAEIVTVDGRRERFVFTPHFYGVGVKSSIPDTFDEVKLFVASIIYGNRFASGARIRDPIALVKALIRDGEVGPASPIGTDYPLLETAGIVSVKESSRPGRYYMKLVKPDVATHALDVLRTGYLETVSGLTPDQATGLWLPRGFKGPAQRRVELGQPAAPSRIAQERLIRAMRGEDLL